MFNLPTCPDSFRGNFGKYSVRIKSVKYQNLSGEDVELENPKSEAMGYLDFFQEAIAGVLQFENRVTVVESKSLVKDESKWRAKGILNMGFGHSTFKGVNNRVEDFFCEFSPFKNIDFALLQEEIQQMSKSEAFYQQTVFCKNSDAQLETQLNSTKEIQIEASAITTRSQKAYILQETVSADGALEGSLLVGLDYLVLGKQIRFEYLFRDIKVIAGSISFQDVNVYSFAEGDMNKVQKPLLDDDVVFIMMVEI